MKSSNVEDNASEIDSAVLEKAYEIYSDMMVKDKGICMIPSNLNEVRATCDKVCAVVV